MPRTLILLGQPEKLYKKESALGSSPSTALDLLLLGVQAPVAVADGADTVAGADTAAAEAAVAVTAVTEAMAAGAAAVATVAATRRVVALAVGAGAGAGDLVTNALLSMERPGCPR
ncbi:UNVERIFIED_CONTAM: hypothetical protein K2H54_025536 [Gekko kuhli]